MKNENQLFIISDIIIDKIGSKTVLQRNVIYEYISVFKHKEDVGSKSFVNVGVLYRFV